MQRRAIVLGTGLFASIVLGAFLLLAGGVLAQEPASPAAPAIQLVKTVGTSPAICATTDSITLPPGGGLATYCYEVTNTGGITLSLHTLADDRLGTILSNFPYSLAPGASAFLTQSASITTTTVNAETWTSFNPGPTDEASATDSAEVVVLVPSITLTKTVGTDPAICATTDSIALPVGGGSVTYCYEVTNTGGITLSLHTLADDPLGTILSNFPYSLAPGASAFLTESAIITETTVNMATWTAFNPGPIHLASATDSAEVIVTAPAPSVVLTKTVGTDPAICSPTDSIALSNGGGSVTYCYEVTNTGNITLSRHSLVDDQLGAILTDFPYHLAPGASAFLTQTATVTQTKVNTATWTAYNPGPVYETASSASATVIVEHLLYLPVLRRE